MPSAPQAWELLRYNASCSTRNRNNGRSSNVWLRCGTGSTSRRRLFHVLTVGAALIPQVPPAFVNGPLRRV